MTDFDKYFDYINSESFLGKIYRKYFLYPRLNCYLNGSVLDIGCGLGNFLKFRPNTYGVDINKRFVNYCSNLGLSVSLMELDKLPFENSHFNSVLLDNVLEHIPNPSKLLAEIFRVLKNDGIVLIGVPGSRGWLSDEDHKIFYNESLLIETLAAHHFIVSELFYMPFFKSELLSRHLKQYCLFGVFTKFNSLR